jgi:hypothetical protein
MNEIIKEYIRRTNCKIIINKLQKIKIESIHIKWMNEWKNIFVELVVNKL